ncbi:tRNA (adenosine(37)-N6)-threonylcarbamoyltransferase complex transferase subunit TsaD [Candidatus Parcubacteria bacterium]|uniref:tRNA N6-adenosine threonylcarbamoyltransferase n=1 Tax=Candidatus Kaiserbacteria bacterium CG10_big_fil_rev_8_21_14_0_10_47_16 TaxID=1974608 RepID=A0A2H0UCY0_9BACT|nr:tRNA (adenosine(37)-N6)-threonylcarbamoyltransferase complex transferase subunit TsaD [Candidatus Parcubacteria bacterium]PIR84283.1 MAG: tRNA (adenosine(37)-N6)-threonylcarbamoyltransferase complex transferase subunit TsaD [Candidatus Kaiserbacteria bacterium CG10_big_fil_rev_8_21_14_0_10_47_16]
MNILSIETSCDETAVSIVRADGDFPDATYTLLGNALFSQIDIHREYGGVFPMVAKREHAKTLVPMTERALKEAELLSEHAEKLESDTDESLRTLFYREEELADALIPFVETYAKPDIDVIAVTHGPGLEPALWVGVNFAKALAMLWGIPVVGTNHMEGHVLASVFDGTKLAPLSFPAVSLLISGGHTELLKMKSWTEYEMLGQTRDDAVGEAFDKAARMMGLQYPGGPEISVRAARAREKNLPPYTKLPKPMIDSGDCDFSFSGLKTAVRYAIRDITGEKEMTEEEREALSRDFEDVVTEVLLKKSILAVEESNAHALILGGGVTANSYIREQFKLYFNKKYPDLALHFPERNLSTDNSIMIALAGHARLDESHSAEGTQTSLKADGNLSLSQG